MSDIKKKQPKDVTCAIHDYGLFTSFAECLARTHQFKRVLYHYAPKKRAFPESDLYQIGNGIEGVEWIEDLESHKSEIDLYIFPDILDSSLQKDLESQGKLVWGMRDAEKLELDRYYCRQAVKSAGLPIIPGTVCRIGVDHLREYLKTHENVWVKTSYFRGTSETFKSPRYEVSQDILDDLCIKYWNRRDSLVFIIEPDTPAQEAGSDIWTVNSSFPEIGMWGFEEKDCLYCGKIQPYKDFPKQLQKTNAGLAKFFGKSKGFFSTEERVISKDTSYMTDFCSRAGVPPMDCEMEGFDNWGEIVFYGAQGILVKPKPKFNYVVESLMFSNWARDHQLKVFVPKEYRQWVKLRNLTVKDGIPIVIPTLPPVTGVGAVVGGGKTLDEAVERCNLVASHVEGIEIEIRHNWDKVFRVIEESKKLGLNFGDK